MLQEKRDSVAALTESALFWLQMSYEGKNAILIPFFGFGSEQAHWSRDLYKSNAITRCLLPGIPSSICNNEIRQYSSGLCPMFFLDSAITAVQSETTSHRQRRFLRLTSCNSGGIRCVQWLSCFDLVCY